MIKQLVAYYLRYYEIYGTNTNCQNYYLNDNDDDYYYAQVMVLKHHGQIVHFGMITRQRSNFDLATLQNNRSQKIRPVLFSVPS